MKNLLSCMQFGVAYPWHINTMGFYSVTYKYQTSTCISVYFASLEKRYARPVVKCHVTIQ